MPMLRGFLLCEIDVKKNLFLLPGELDMCGYSTEAIDPEGTTKSLPWWTGHESAQSVLDRHFLPPATFSGGLRVEKVHHSDIPSEIWVETIATGPKATPRPGKLYK